MMLNPCVFTWKYQQRPHVHQPIRSALSVRKRTVTVWWTERWTTCRTFGEVLIKWLISLIAFKLSWVCVLACLIYFCSIWQGFFFFTYGTLSSGSRTPQSHWVNSAFLTAHFSCVFVLKHAALLSICNLVVIRLCYLQNVSCHGCVDGQWTTKPKIKMKGRHIFYLLYYLLI